MELPVSKMPKKIYINGRLLTLGIFGSSVECAYAGKHLIFAPGLLDSYVTLRNHTIILEYKDKTYNYNIFLGEGNKVIAALLSII